MLNRAPPVIFRLTFFIFIFASGFDDYFLSLRPPLLLSDCSNQEVAARKESAVATAAAVGKDKEEEVRLNCRNPWFRQFWSHHFSCRFEDQKESEVPPEHHGRELLPLCTGKERLVKYEQEGLVPFVGE